MITDKKRASKIARIAKQMSKKREELNELRKKVKAKEIELAGLGYDLNQLTEKGS